MIQLGLAAEATADGDSRDRLTVITGSVGQTLEEIREVSHGLYPPLLADSGLVAALLGVKRRTPVPLSIDTDGVGRYSPEVESALYYACLEAIQNATKHGGPDVHIAVGLHQDDDHVGFDVEDDGPGFELERVTGTGLRNMHDRLGALGGRLTVRTAPGNGTLISGRVPLRG